MLAGEAYEKVGRFEDAREAIKKHVEQYRGRVCRRDGRSEK